MKKIDRFILKEILSDSSAGTVYRADENLPGDNLRPVALKVLPAIAENDQPARSRYFAEIKILAQLTVHPNIVTIYSMGFTDNYPWLAMEFASKTLAAELQSDPADPALIIRILTQVARGLAAMHALTPPLLHQDLKPANILIDTLGNCKITDFSLASVVAAHRTQSLATVKYAAPEMLSSEFGRVSPATDLYALGHIAYELALGQRLHRAQFPAVFEGNSAKEPPPNKWMMWHASQSTLPAPIVDVVKTFPINLSAIIQRLLAKSLTQRYSSADDLLHDLAALSAAPVPVAAPAKIPTAKNAQLPATPDVVPPAVPAPIENVPTPSVPAAPTAPSAQYWVRLRGRTTGPFDLPTLQRQIRQGHLSRLHQLSTDQLHWKQASEIEGLYGPTVV